MDKKPIVKRKKALTKTDINKKAMIKALSETRGIVTTACKTVGISRETHYKYVREDEDYKLAVESVEGIALDEAESELFKLIAEGNVVAILFYLKTKGKKRGYTEKIEIDGKLNTDGNVTHRIELITRDEIDITKIGYMRRD